MNTISISNRSHARRAKLIFAPIAALISALSLGPATSVAQGRANPNNLVTRIEVLEQSVQAQEAEIQRLKEQLQAPVEVTLQPVARGSYRSDGTHLSAGAGYIAGDIRGDVPSFPQELRNYFVFDLTEVREALGAGETEEITVVEADLSIFNPATGFKSTADDTETYRVNRAGLSFSGGDPVFDLMAGTAGTNGFTDLADGPGYGSYVVSARASNPGDVFIALTKRALDDMNFRLREPTDGGPSPTRPESRLFAIGGSIKTLNEVPDNEFLFADTAASPVALFVKVRIAPPESQM